MKSYADCKYGLFALVIAPALALVACAGDEPPTRKRLGDTPQAPAEAAVKAPERRDWPMFGGTPSRNMANTWDKGIPTEWSVKKGTLKNVKWVAELGNQSYGNPVVAGGRVFVGTNNEKPRDPKLKGDMGILMCFRESDGAFLWQAAHEKLPHQEENDSPYIGIVSSPTVAGDRVYYVSNACELVCADVAGNPETRQAKIIWRLDMYKDLKVNPHQASLSSPVVVGDIVFVVASNGVDMEKHIVVSPEAPSFLAVNKNTGKVIWKDNSPGKDIMEGQWTNPTYAEINGKGQIIMPGGDGWLRSFEPATGKLIWKFDCNPKKSVYKLGGRGDRNYFVATPVVYDNKVYIGVGQNPDEGGGVGHFWCIDPSKTGDISPVNDDFDPKSPANKNSGLVWHYGGPVLPKPANNRDREIVFGRTASTAAVHDGLVYISDLESYVHCLDAKTGKKYWEYDFKTIVWGSPYWVDNKVYIGTEDGQIGIFEHGKEKKEPRIVEMGRPIKSTPVVANGVMYILTDRNLYAIAEKAQ